MRTKIGSPEFREKMRNIALERGYKPPSREGVMWSQEEKEKLSRAHKGKFLGENSPRWLGGNKRNSHMNIQRSYKKRGIFGLVEYSEWIEICEEFGDMCLCCGKSKEEAKITMDHIIPLSKGGANTANNLQPLCLSCNAKKGNKTIDYRRRNK